MHTDTTTVICLQKVQYAWESRVPTKQTTCCTRKHHILRDFDYTVDVNTKHDVAILSNISLANFVFLGIHICIFYEKFITVAFV